MGWFTEPTGGTKIDLDTYVFKADLNLYARWKLVYRVTFDLNYNNAPDGGTADNNQEGKVTKADPTRTGYTFNGWFTERIEGELINLNTMAFDTIQTLYAHWRSETKAHSFFVSTTSVVSSIQLSITSSLALNDLGAVIRLATETVPTKTETMASAGYVTLTVSANEARKFSVSQHYGSVFTGGLTLADVLSPNTAYKLYLYFPANSISTATTELMGISLTGNVGEVELTTVSLPTEGDAIWTSQWTSQWTAGKYVSSLNNLFFMEGQTGVSVVYFKPFENIIFFNLVTKQINTENFKGIGTYSSNTATPSTNFYFNYATITGYSSDYSYCIVVDKTDKILNFILARFIKMNGEFKKFTIPVTRY